MVMPKLLNLKTYSLFLPPASLTLAQNKELALIKACFEAQKIDHELFAKIMNHTLGSLKVGPTIAVALSGGADSMALCWLLQQWCRSQGGTLLPVIVNHNVRLNMAEEITKVRVELNKLGLLGYVLTLPHQERATQESLRQQRYKILKAFCADRGVKYIFFAHQVEDLIETVEMRLRRGPTVFGHSGFSFCRELGADENASGLVSAQEEGRSTAAQCLVVRPLLFCRKDALKNTLRQAGISWVEDPSNTNCKYERSRVRQYLAKTLKGRLSCALELIINARLYREQLEKDACEWIQQEVSWSRLGELSFSLNAFSQVGLPLQSCIMMRLLRAVGGSVRPIKIKKVQKLLARLQTHFGATQTLNKGTRWSLGGALVWLTDEKESYSVQPSLGGPFAQHNSHAFKAGGQERLWIHMVKENRSIKTAKVSANKQRLRWDNRFEISLPQGYNPAYFFAKLPTKAYNSLWNNNPRNKDLLEIKGLNRLVLMSLPWLFNEEGVPLPQWAARLQTSVTFKTPDHILTERFYNFRAPNLT